MTDEKKAGGPAVEKVTKGEEIAGGVYGNASGVGFHDAHGRAVDEEGNLLDSKAAAALQQAAEKAALQGYKDEQEKIAAEAAVRAEQDRAVAQQAAAEAAERAKAADKAAADAAKGVKAR